MAVMVTMTLKTDAATYQAMHGQLLPMAKQAGMLFHSGHAAEGGVALVDFWPSADAFQKFMEGPAGEAMQAAGMEPPDDIAITEVLTADS